MLISPYNLDSLFNLMYNAWMDLNAIQIFIKVVEAGSFVKAAVQLGLPKSTVSAKVSALEARLGVPLIRRTTRKLFITEAGQSYFHRGAAALQQLAVAEQQLTQEQSVPQGRLQALADRHPRQIR